MSKYAEHLTSGDTNCDPERVQGHDATTLGHQAANLVAIDNTETIPHTPRDEDATRSDVDAGEINYTVKEEWGRLTESFTVQLDGPRPTRVHAYSREYDETWTLFTSVDADTGRVLVSELVLSGNR